MAKHLTNKPLVEALVELKWQLQKVDANVAIDPLYPLFLGRFHERMREHYPAVEQLPTAHMPDEVTPHVVKYRFRATKDGWPLVQAGPGIATLNFTETYDWAKFSEAAKPFFGKLLEAYAVDGTQPRPQFTSAVLRYINALEFDGAKDVLDLLAKQFHTKFELPEKIRVGAEVDGAPQGIQLHTTYSLKKPVGLGAIRLATGAKQGKPALIWEINIVSTDAAVPQDEAAFATWLSDAHDVGEKWFFALIEGDLEKTFGVKEEA